jgi:flagellar biosynthesis protein FlhF
MKVRKYTARSSRDALRQVREDLGPDAVILANRMVKGGVEILAMPASEMAAQVAATEARGAAEAGQPLEVTEDDVVAAPWMRRPAPPRKPWADLGLEPAVAAPPPAPAPPAWSPIFQEPVSVTREAVFGRPDVQAFTPMIAPSLQRESTSAAALKLGPEPRAERVIAPRSALNLRPAPASGPAPAPAVLRRRTPRALQPIAHRTGYASAAAASDAPGPLPTAQLDALAASHDPLIAALADEVKSLGSMLGQASQAIPGMQAATTALNATRASVAPPGRPGLEAVESGQPAAGGDAWMRNMMGELRSMRLLIEDQMGAMVFGEAGRMSGGKARAVRVLSAAGFSAPLIRKLTGRLPEGVSEDDALDFVRRALGTNLAVSASEAELLDRGGVFALVGPTGAGKTTTAAKLAARFVVRHGAENLALLTTDGYRIGGQEQLRIYGKILGVAVYAVKDAEDLRRTLGELRNRKLVLIDTVGLSQRDRMVGEQHEMFARCGTSVKRLLLLNATCHGDTLNDVVRAYRGDGLAGCILTKLDEAAAMGAALDAAIRQRLCVYYAADGQRVPEDLHLADGPELVDLALRSVPNAEDAAAAEVDFPLELPPLQTLAAARPSHGESGVVHG